MDNLIEALRIISKGISPEEGWPTIRYCSHDQLYVKGDWDKFTKEDFERLKDLGFIKCEELGSGFISYGS